MSDENKCGTYTSIDLAESMSYATSKVLYEYCSDPNLLKLICTTDEGKPLNDTNCLLWKKDDNLQSWKESTKLSSKKCDTDSDCRSSRLFNKCISSDDGNYCGCTTSTHKAGTCEIRTEEKCMSESALPYVCDDNSCEDIKPKQYPDITNQEDCTKAGKIWTPASDDDPDSKAVCEDTQKDYLEWRLNDALPCNNETNQCKNPKNCSNGKCTCTSDDDCWGSGVCTKGFCTGGGRCIYGNSYSRKYCENPISRCAPVDGNYPDECKGGPTKVGVTDVPPFRYDVHSGKCFITPKYCSRFNVDYMNFGKDCTQDSDCYDSGGVCDSETRKCLTSNGKCDDSQSVGDIIVNNTIGKTLFALIKNLGKCSKESFVKESSFDWLDFAKIPEEINESIDEKYVLTKEVIKKDLIPGINFYVMTCKFPPYNVSYQKVGFIGNEIKKKFPFIVKKKNGEQYLHMKKKNIHKNEKHLKTIYFYVAKSKNLLNLFIEKANNNFSPEVWDFIENNKEKYGS